MHIGLKSGFFCLLLSLGACDSAEMPSSPSGEPMATPGTPMLWLARNAESGDWFSFAAEAISDHGGALLSSTPADIGAWCPAYSGQSPEERTAFWAFLMSSLMRFESNYDPTTSYTEPFDDAAGNRVVSRGLLQLSIESANGYGCGIGEAEELHDPRTNLSCAVRIMDRWVGGDGVISGQTASGSWRGMARYWSPFRRADALGTMRGEVSASSYCTP
ncbi:hypothetical protein [Pseudoroseicyclus sp. CXY001]|uniref:hypothetical protein n=1 Tax=Pseudoroseicyclus sp. CXY001 TaxID=3242492 RepID=UPI003570DE93